MPSSTYLSYAECSALALDIYKYKNQGGAWVVDPDPMYQPLPPNIKLFRICNAQDTLGHRSAYCGAAYIKMNEKGEPGLLVIANRGTVFDMENLIDDLLVFGHVPPSGMLAAQKFLQEVQSTDLYKKVLKDLDVVFVGHSLGAVISDLLCVSFRNIEENINEGVEYHGTSQATAETFDNPGSLPMLYPYLKMQGFEEEEIRERLGNGGQNHTNFLTNVNVVNTCNPHFGNIYRVRMHSEYRIDNVDPPIAIPIYPQLNLYYLKHYTAQQHAMVNIHKYIKHKEEKGCYAYPLEPGDIVGLKEGYIQYLTIDGNHKYWHGYIEHIWSIFPQEAKDRYNNNINEFYVDMFGAIDFARARLMKTYKYPTEKNQTESLANVKISETGLGLFNVKATGIAKEKKSRVEEIQDVKPIEDDFVVIDRDKKEDKLQEEKPGYRCAIM